MARSNLARALRDMVPFRMADEIPQGDKNGEPLLSLD